MNTARDLAIVALGVASDRPVDQGDLSLALAGAEVLDLVDALALVVEGDRLVPGGTSVTGDRLLDEAAASLVRREPYESVEDWLWRRGRGLASAYTADMEREGLTARPRGRLIPLRSARTVLVDSAARQRAETRWAAREPVLAALADAAGIAGVPAGAMADAAGREGVPAGAMAEAPEAPAAGTDDGVVTVLAAVGDAVMELEAVRQRRVIEQAAFDNIWRGQ